MAFQAATGCLADSLVFLSKHQQDLNAQNPPVRALILCFYNGVRNYLIFNYMGSLRSSVVQVFCVGCMVVVNTVF